MREEDTLPATVPLAYPDAFSDSYSDRTAVRDADWGARSTTIRALLGRCCAGWDAPPTSAEFFDAIT